MGFLSFVLDCSELQMRGAEVEARVPSLSYNAAQEGFMAEAGMKGSTMIPAMRYRDAHGAINWLVKVLGFTAQAVHDGPEGTVAHAQLTLGAGMVMLGSASNAGPGMESRVQPEEIGGRSTGGVYVVVADAGAVWARVVAAGAAIVQELREMEYGGRAFICKDPEGFVWSVGEYDPWI